MRKLLVAAAAFGSLALSGAAFADCTGDDSMTVRVYDENGSVLGGEYVICFGSQAGPIDEAIWWWSNLF